MVADRLKSEFNSMNIGVYFCSLASRSPSRLDVLAGLNKTCK